MARIHNFSAGPAVLPEPVLRKAQQAVWDFQDSGVGIMECSHRTARYEAVVAGAEEKIRRLCGLSKDYAVLFLQGGASSQFFMIPASFLQNQAAYLDTGYWSTKAIQEAKIYGETKVLWSGRETRYVHVPQSQQWCETSTEFDYFHYTSNNTIYGTQFQYIPDTNGVPLVCDASSDIFSKPIDFNQFDLIYAGAQKNLGPSGVTLVIVRKSWMEKAKRDLPSMLRYAVHAENQSMYNTPNTWGIYLLEEVCTWMEQQGGLEAMAVNNRRQAEAVYSIIDRSGFYKGFSEKSCRSWMNLTFTTGDAALDTRFHTEADAAGLFALKGHRVLGALRASLYNGQTDAAVDALVEFMNDFERVNG